MRVLSLFDGMACGMLAMQMAGIEVERYVAYEIDKYATKTSTHNFPMIEQRGDVFTADFTEFAGFDFLIGGSPCTYWSIAQTNNRETEAIGMGWELFSQYVRALHEAKPKFFVYENNKSMAKAIRESIDKAFGFEAIGINSALVSAQNRHRLYWVGKRNGDGTYSKVPIEQPEDLGILLKDILESGQCWKDKSYTIDSNYYKTLGQQGFDHQSGRRKMVAEPLNPTSDGKGRTLIAGYYKQGIENCCGFVGFGSSGVAEPVAVDLQVVGRKRNDDGEWERSWEAHTDGKSSALTSVESRRCVAEPVAMRQVGRRINENGHRDDYNENLEHIQRYEVNENPQQTNCLTTVTKDNMVAEPIRVGTWPNNAKNQAHDSQQYRIYSTEGKGVTLCGNGGGMGAKTGLYAIPCCNMIVKEATKKGYTEIKPMACVDMTQPNSKTRRGRNMADKSNCCMTSCQHYQYCGVLAYATPCEWDEDGKVTKAVSCADGKTYTVYEVWDGKIAIKGKEYPIKLVDGYYIIRKLTVRECMRLQTVPEWYEFPVSDSQAYKMLGNGWTCRVIEHLLRACMATLDHPAPEKEPKRVVVKRINKQEE